MNTLRSEIVVGIDGSASSKAALSWAEEYAQGIDGSLTLVTVWHWPTSYGAPLAYEGFDPQQDARRTVDAAKAELSLPANRIRTLVAEGHPGRVLTDASRDAVALVVGTRGHGGIVSIGLGSTSTYCVHHGHCPVVVVR
ncbi:MAG TPA: universal stress protein [Mycobacteriales bacterium]|jgi:nucleotide-binding universal stress UspA family protein|nr:universal stress protein [Mycobacteriales bacterium]